MWRGQWQPTPVLFLLLFKFYFIFYFIFFHFTILYWFCHTSTWIRHGCIVPNTEPPSHLPPHTISLGHSSASAPSILHPTPVLLPSESHGWKSLEGCSPWGRWGSDTTEWPHSHFSLSCIEEGNGTPLQGSCLENPRDRGAWWAAIYEVTQSRTRLKLLSSSSSSSSSRYRMIPVILPHLQRH